MLKSFKSLSDLRRAFPDEDACINHFSVRNGTIFDDSKISMMKWFEAIFLMTSHKKGISSCQLAKDIGVTQKTAWFMLHRIRNAALTTEFNAPLSGTVEPDEAYVGANPRFQHKDKRKPLLFGMAAAKEKKIVFGMLQRDGDLRVHHVPDARKNTLQPIILDNIAKGAKVYTDEAHTYA